MKWLHAYLIYFSFWTCLFLREIIPLLKHLVFAFPSVSTWIALFGYYSSVAILGYLLPGPVYQGAKLADGSHLSYKCNGLLILFVLTALFGITHVYNIIPATLIADRYSEFFIASNLFSVVLSIILFIKGKYFQQQNNKHGHGQHSNILDEFIMGTELNPFILKLNIKFFSYRPSMMGWFFVNLSFLMKQYALLNNAVTSRMIIYQLLTGWYIIDYFVNEPKMLSTWDIIAEHFGFMLVWGDYVFIIFAFSVQNFFLLNNTSPMSMVEICSTLLFFICGFIIFRGANSQKHQFKNNHNVKIWGKTAKTIQGKLLVSGFWGIARHLNYTGDCLLALSYCLPCGFNSVLPYLYFVYLMLLTIHREKRDDDRCSHKYKHLWDEYCRQVPYRMVPFVY